MSHILVVDDEQDICEILQFNFESEGFVVTTANSAEEALELLPQEHPDLLLLDVMMDRMSGFEMARRLRSEGNQVPIIFLTAKTQERDQLDGFEFGADDYITKPFSFSTVLARVKAVLKRTSPSCQQLLDLTKKEQQILDLLMRHKGEYVTRDQILDEVWGSDIYVAERSVDVHIARLRKKMGAEGMRIRNKTNFGYRFD
ncbi:MAG: response regulator transcription factor [Bacteroidales bacterium]|nr:response regulator transcription factor [Candidatus Colimorpha pelethequi]